METRVFHIGFRNRVLSVTEKNVKLTTTGHVIGPTCHYDVIDIVFVLLQSGAAALLGNKHNYDVIDFFVILQYDVIMTSRFYDETSWCFPFVSAEMESITEWRISPR